MNLERDADEEELPFLLSRPLPADAALSPSHLLEIHRLIDEQTVARPQWPRRRRLEILSVTAVVLTLVGLFAFRTDSYERNLAADTPAPDWVHFKVKDVVGHDVETWISPSLNLFAIKDHNDQLWVIFDLGKGHQLCLMPGAKQVRRWPLGATESESHRRSMEITRALFFENRPVESTKDLVVLDDLTRSVRMEGKEFLERSIRFQEGGNEGRYTVRLDPVTKRAEQVTIVLGKNQREIIQVLDYPAAGPASPQAFGLPDDVAIIDGRPTSIKQQLLEFHGRLYRWFRGDR
ncbi:hypothetical protein K2X85_11930 [bacterium]|nr:hypothetical protein [bacterium]